MPIKEKQLKFDNEQELSADTPVITAIAILFHHQRFSHFTSTQKQSRGKKSMVQLINTISKF